MNKLILLTLLLSVLLTGCAGTGLNKKTTLVPDEVWITSDINLNNEDSGEVGFGFKWKLK